MLVHDNFELMGYSNISNKPFDYPIFHLNDKLHNIQKCTLTQLYHPGDNIYIIIKGRKLEISGLSADQMQRITYLHTTVKYRAFIDEMCHVEPKYRKFWQ